jgi:hypothetical protein
MYVMLYDYGARLNHLWKIIMMCALIIRIIFFSFTSHTLISPSPNNFRSSCASRNIYV